MKIHRFIGDFDLSKKEVEITGDEAHQISQVLKLKTGEEIELCDKNSISTLVEIVSVSKKLVKVKILKKNNKKNALKNVTLFCSILKKENFELTVQKATECGISKIVPIISARTIKTGLNIERLRKIAKEAAEQSGRTSIPEISESVKFTPEKSETKSILFDITGASLLSKGELLHEKPCAGRRPEQSKFSAENYASFSDNNSQLCIYIGPEGGWTPEEIEKAKSAGFAIASLGPLTLRGETAAIIASYLAVNL